MRLPRMTSLVLFSVMFSFSPYTMAENAAPSIEALEQAPIPAGYSRMFVFRKYAEPLAFDTTFRIEDQPVAALAQKQFTVLLVKEAEYGFAFSWNPVTATPRFEMLNELVAGKTYFIEIHSIASRLTGEQRGRGFNVFNRKMGLEKIKDCCTYVAPKMETFPSP